ncbi:MAG: hypothetical protein VX699_12660 [Myxococcota bacterium]|nr:hypothetical protein [Myxococcota bacterium]
MRDMGWCRLKSVARRGLLLGLVCLMALSCNEELNGETAPDKDFYFPVNLEVADSRFVFVLNSNFDQRYNSGWVQVLDLQGITEDAPQGDALLSRKEGGQLRVLSLGGDLALDRSENPRKLIVSHRGSGTLSEINLSSVDGGVAMECGDPEAVEGLGFSEQLTDCDRDHLFILSDHLPEEALSAADVRDPFALTFFNHQERLQLGLGFLNLERLFTFDIDPTASIWLGEPGQTKLGAGTQSGTESLLLVSPDAVAGEAPFLTATGNEKSFIYNVELDKVESEDEEAVSRFSVNSTAAGLELVDMVFSKGDPSRAYVVTNRPGSVVALEVVMRSEEVMQGDGSYKRERRPTYQVVGALPLDGRPTGLVSVTRGDRDILFVTGFENNEVFVVDAGGPVLTVERRLSEDEGVGAGPFSVAAVDCSGWPDQSPECARLVVGNFLDHTLTVFDIGSAHVGDFKKIAVVGAQ